MSTPELDTNYQGSFIQVQHDGSINHEIIYPNRPREKMLGRPDYEIVYAGEGTYVDLIDRSEHLIAALEAFSSRNQRLGLGVAANDLRHNQPIYARYRQAVPFVQKRAEVNTQKFLEVAKDNFWRATGFIGLRQTNLASNRAINARARIMWENFSSEYGTPNHRKRRLQYRKSLHKAGKLALESLPNIEQK